MLLQGQYDEREAKESFQKALLDWRKRGAGATSNKVQIIRDTPTPTSRDAVVNTELRKENMRQLDLIKNLEAYITSNHTLSYADRMLLQMYRRNRLFDYGDKERENIEKSSTPELDRNIRETVNLGIRKKKHNIVYMCFYCLYKY